MSAAQNAIDALAGLRATIAALDGVGLPRAVRTIVAPDNDNDNAMAMATAAKWIARYAPVNVDEIGYEAAYVGAIRH